MSDLGHLKHNQRVMLIVTIGMVFGKNSCRFAFLVSSYQLLEGVDDTEHGRGQFYTLPVETNHRGDSGMNHSDTI